MPKVVKFGGSSLASAAQFQKAGEIIRSEKSRKYVVPSAPGKQDSKTSNLQICCICVMKKHRVGGTIPKNGHLLPHGTKKL